MRTKVIFFSLVVFLIFATGCAVASSSPSMASSTKYSEDIVYIKVNGQTLVAKLADNSSGVAFKKYLQEHDGSITVNMHDYGGFEKVGPLGTTLVQNNEPITTEPGDVILYCGNQITIYYDTNSWDFTHLAKNQEVSQQELKTVLGSGNVTVVFSLER